ncbi:hypothetical protein ACJMK2_013934, partial [Sinanodonta woodiana]
MTSQETHNDSLEELLFVSQIVTRSVAKRRAAEAAVSEPILLDLPIPAIVREEKVQQLIEYCAEHIEEIGPETSK